MENVAVSIESEEQSTGSLFTGSDDLRQLRDVSKDIRRVASEKAIARGMESIRRARAHAGTITNDMIVVGHFAAAGVPESEIRPRENVFTFNGWKALGRFVRKGEHGCKLTTYVPVRSKSEETDEETDVRAVTTFVFHVSQTEAYGVRK